MKKYLVLVSFAGPEVGAHAAGEEIELNAEDAKALAPFIQLVGKPEKIETAEMPQDGIEKAVKRGPKKG